MNGMRYCGSETGSGRGTGERHRSAIVPVVDTVVVADSVGAEIDLVAVVGIVGAALAAAASSCSKSPIQHHSGSASLSSCRMPRSHW